LNLGQEAITWEEVNNKGGRHRAGGRTGLELDLLGAAEAAARFGRANGHPLALNSAMIPSIFAAVKGPRERGESPFPET
jgi:hypothetical protein